MGDLVAGAAITGLRCLGLAKQVPGDEPIAWAQAGSPLPSATEVG